MYFLTLFCKVKLLLNFYMLYFEILRTTDEMSNIVRVFFID